MDANAVSRGGNGKPYRYRGATHQCQPKEHSLRQARDKDEKNQQRLGWLQRSGEDARHLQRQGKGCKKTWLADRLNLQRKFSFSSAVFRVEVAGMQLELGNILDNNFFFFFLSFASRLLGPAERNYFSRQVVCARLAHAEWDGPKTVGG